MKTRRSYLDLKIETLLALQFQRLTRYQIFTKANSSYTVITKILNELIASGLVEYYPAPKLYHVTPTGLHAANQARGLMEALDITVK